MKKKLLLALVLVLVLALTIGATYAITYTNLVADFAEIMANSGSVSAKMAELEAYLEAYFIDDYDLDAIRSAAGDGAAAAMIEATGDRWSYYISAEDMDAHNEQLYNAYVGIGITILETENGMEVKTVTAGGPAEAAGVQVGDLLTAVEGVSTAELGLDETKNRVRGEAGTTVNLTFERGGEAIELTVERADIVNPVATAQMLEDDIGLITIENFDYHCAEQTLAAIDTLLEQGAKALIFDVRFNPGGLKDQMVEVLDKLLPEGDIFRSVDYAGKEEVDKSDAACLEIPMAVLVNEDSYSAAEFFAAALQEYGVAEVVGMQTSGKGNFQYTFNLSDGSAVALSVGKYFTPSGKSLTDVGVTPDVEVNLDYADYEFLYYGTLAVEEDEQLQAAVEVLREKIS